MILHRLRIAGLLVGLGLSTVACTDGYGYSGVDVGYADPYYGTGYGDYYGGYGAAGYGYGGYGGFGWYGDYYYPGTGIYVYDRYRRPYRWNDNQRRYWEGRGGYRGDNRGNWNGFANNGRGRDGRLGFAGNRPGDGQGFRGNRGAPDGQAIRGNDGGGRDFGSRQGFRGGDGARAAGGNRSGFGGGRGGGGGGRRGR